MDARTSSAIARHLPAYGASEPLPRASLHGTAALRVLLVQADLEDYALTRCAVAQMSSFRCDVRWARTFDAAVDALRAGDVDLLILDQHLGARTGLELLREVFGERPTLPVVLLAGVADRETDLDASSMGVAALLEKTALTAAALDRSVQYAIERARAERELQSARAFFRAGFDALEEQVAILDAAGAIVEVNAAWRRFACENGAGSVSWRGVSYVGACDTASGDDAAAAARGIREVLAGDRAAFRLEYACHAPDQERWCAMRVVRFEDAGRVLLYVAHQDMTDRYRAERAQRASERRYRHLVETAHEGICTVDASGSITYANRRLAAMLGYRMIELAGRSIFEFMEPEAQFAARTRFARRHRGISEVDEVPFRRSNGTTLWVRQSSSSIVVADGAPAGAVYMLSDITEHRAAQQRLAESERHFRALTEHASELVAVIDAGGAIRYANLGVSRLLGYLPEEVVGVRALDFVHEDDTPWVRERLDDITRGPGAMATAEYRVRHKDGTWRTLHTVAQNLLADAAVAGIVINAHDVTERHRAELELREAHETMATLVNASPLAIVTVDAQGTVLSWNAAAERIFGWTAEEVVGRVYPLLPPSELAAYYQRLRVQLAVGHVSSGDETRRLRKDGSFVDVSLSTATMRHPDGRALGVVAFLADITARKDAEAALGEARRKTELLLASAGEGIFALDAWGTITFANPVAARLFGSTVERMVGQDAHGLVHHSRPDGSPYPEAACLIRASVRDGAVHRVDGDVFWRVDGTSYPVEYVTTPLYEDGRIVGAVVAFQDITERRKLESQLRQAQKMDAVGRLAGGVAHDFNNLLTVITSYTGMLLTELPTEDPIRTDLQEIEAASARAASLTRQLLAFSRQQVLHPRVVDLHRVVGEMASMLRRLIAEDIALTITGDGVPAHVLADPGQIEQVVMNLVVNGRDAMPAGGALSIAIASVRLDPHDLEHMPYVVPGHYACIVVTDNGCGMDDATQARIFEPFYTTKEAGKGTGLGLATVYGIVKQTGGYVVVESAPGMGTTFRIYLPTAAADEADLAEPVAARTLVPEQGGATVLLAEDEDSLRAITERILRKCGYVVLCARDGVHALEIAERHDGPIHLLITDVVMPQMSGPALADRLAMARGDIPVLFITGYSMDAVTSHGVLRPGSGLLHKPFTPHDIALAVSELLYGSEGTRATDQRPPSAMSAMSAMSPSSPPD